MTTPVMDRTTLPDRKPVRHITTIGPDRYRRERHDVPGMVGARWCPSCGMLVVRGLGQWWQR